MSSLFSPNLNPCHRPTTNPPYYRTPFRAIVLSLFLLHFTSLLLPPPPSHPIDTPFFREFNLLFLLLLSPPRIHSSIHISAVVCIDTFFCLIFLIPPSIMLSTTAFCAFQSADRPTNRPTCCYWLPYGFNSINCCLLARARCTKKPLATFFRLMPKNKNNLMHL